VRAQAIPCALTGDRATINRLNNRNNAGLQISAVRAEIINSGECSTEGHSVRGPAPILALCRELIKSGFRKHTGSIRIDFEWGKASAFPSFCEIKESNGT
jgi:hypothetical protein